MPFYICILKDGSIFITICSYLKTLLEPFNEIVSKFLDQIKPLTDEATAVPMKVHFGELTHDVISKVSTLHLIVIR